MVWVPEFDVSGGSPNQDPQGAPHHQVVRFVSEALAQSGDAGVACAALCEEALRRGSGDNMTAMVVQFREGAGLRITARLG